MKKACTVVTAMFVLVVLAGCNTGKGMGKDMEQSGKNIQETIDKNQ